MAPECFRLLYFSSLIIVKYHSDVLTTIKFRRSSRHFYSKVLYVLPYFSPCILYHPRAHFQFRMLNHDYPAYLLGGAVELLVGNRYVPIRDRCI